MQSLLYLQTAVSAVAFLLALGRFPARPTFAPTASAAVAREHVLAGFRKLCRNVNFVILILTWFELRKK